MVAKALGGPLPSLHLSPPPGHEQSFYHSSKPCLSFKTKPQAPSSRKLCTPSPGTALSLRVPALPSHPLTVVVPPSASGWCKVDKHRDLGQIVWACSKGAAQGVEPIT